MRADGSLFGRAARTGGGGLSCVRKLEPYRWFETQVVFFSSKKQKLTKTQKRQYLQKKPQIGNGSHHEKKGSRWLGGGSVTGEKGKGRMETGGHVSLIAGVTIRAPAAAVKAGRDRGPSVTARERDWPLIQ